MALGELPSGCILHGVPFGQPCYWCHRATWTPPPAAPVMPTAPGWTCPRCTRSLAPFMVACPFCVPPGPRPAEPVYGDLMCGPLIRLPARAADPGFAWHAKIGGRWREVFTDLQARRVSVSHDDALGAVADIEFRLTPPENGRDDD